jgi:hypothetical protein
MKEKTKEKLQQHKLGILSFLIIVLMAASFYGGVIISCQDGYLKGVQCVTPKKVATVSVCEYNPISCAVNCENALVNDVGAFCKQYTNKFTLP